MAEKHLEIERKYDATADFSLPDLSGLPGVAALGDPESQSLHATYFDTEDLRLAAHGITLRRRRGGADAGWHLKVPVGPDSKQELRAPLGRARIVPLRLAALVAARTRGAPLVPVATLETERTVVRLLDADGEVLAEIADDAVTGRDLRDDDGTTAAPPAPPAQADPADPAGPADTAALAAPAPASPQVTAPPEVPRQALPPSAANGTAAVAGNGSGAVTVLVGTEPAPSGERWREIEVELVAGPPSLLKAAGRRLRKAGAARAGSSSKLGRLLGGSIEPDPASAARAAARARAATAKPSTGDAVVAYLAAQVEALLDADPRARNAEDDAVHQMRVAVRRLRSALQSYRAVLDRGATDPLRPELKWLAAVLGEVRDLEVLRMRFTGRLDELGGDGPGDAGPAGPAAPPVWLEDIVRQERGAYRRLNVILKEPRYFALLDALDSLVAEPPLAGRAAGRRAAKELPRLVTKSWRRLEKTYATIAASTEADTDTARHDTRKAAKRARYAAELAAPVLGAPAAKAVKNAKRIQQVLGGHQDGVIAMERLGAAVGRTRSTSEAFTLGVLYGVERAEAEAARDRLEDTWAGVSAPAF